MITREQSQVVATYREGQSPAPSPSTRGVRIDEFPPAEAPATVDTHRAALREPEAAEAETSSFSLFLG